MLEFDHVYASVSKPAELTERLTTKSQDGWEVVGIYTSEDSVIAIIKRNAPFISSTTTTAAATTTPASVSQPNTTQSVAAPTAAAPANWYPDPSGRFELRYWNGDKWTEHVSRAGQQSVDAPVK